jgi:hypothetical protein
MRFDKLKDPAAAASKESTRYAIQGVAIVERDGGTFLVATDGRALTLVRCHPDDGDDMSAILGQGRIYAAAAFNAARKAARRKPDARLTLNGAAWVDAADGSHVEFPRVEGTFPDVACAIPKGEPAHVVRLDAEYLATIQRALGADGVEVRVHGDGEPLTIGPIYMHGGVADGSIGILMPIGGS